MKKRFAGSMLSAVLAALLLGGCMAVPPGETEAPSPSPPANIVQSPAPDDPAPPEETQPAEDEMAWGWLSSVDFNAYQGVLDETSWTVLSGFLPVLLEDEPFILLEYADEPRQELTIKALGPHLTYDGLTSDDCALSDSGEPALGCFALCDLDQDGNTELVLSFCGSELTTSSPVRSDVCTYLILHREGETVYGMISDWRSLYGLQRDGIYLSVPGTGTTYCRMYFREEAWHEEMLGSSCMVPHMIGEDEVSMEEFYVWAAEIMVGDVSWIDPISA